MARPEKEPETEFAKRLRSVREHLGVAERAEFASKLGVPTTTYATWERGKNIIEVNIWSKYYLVVDW